MRKAHFDSPTDRSAGLRGGNLVSCRSAIALHDRSFNSRGWRLDGSFSAISLRASSTSLKSIEGQAKPMESAANQKALVAMDLGAQSCRVSLFVGIAANPRLKSFIVFRTRPFQTTERLRWDIDAIFDGICGRIAFCALLLRPRALRRLAWTVGPSITSGWTAAGDPVVPSLLLSRRSNRAGGEAKFTLSCLHRGCIP